MAYLTLTRKGWQRALLERREGDNYPDSAIGQLNGDEPAEIQACADAIVFVRTAVGSSMTNAEFDTVVSVEFHRRASLTPERSEDDNLWRWLAITVGPDLVERRHGSNDRPAGLGNFGLGARWDNLFRRLWFRAELSYDPAATDPYSLTKRGVRDFWDSGIIRHRYGSARNLTKAFVKLQYPDPSRPMQGRWPILADDYESPGIRTLYRRLNRVHATVAFDVLSEDDCTSILTDLSRDLP